MKNFWVACVSRGFVFAVFVACMTGCDSAKRTPGTNSLGMKFVPVGNMQFSVYLTTRQNFEAFADATHLKSQAWRNPGFQQGSAHPVVNVTWHEANAFCSWLTETERKTGLLKASDCYRLPTDLEWSKAVGLSEEYGVTPEDRDMGVQDVYPWGKQWPPPHDAGNYSAEPEAQTGGVAEPGYDDGYRHTSPVGKFRVNAFGLYDMGGNVWQWTGDDFGANHRASPMRGSIRQWLADIWNPKSPPKTLRGASWYNGAIPLSLLSSCRISSSPDAMNDTYGFRIVKATDSGFGRWFFLKTSIFVLLVFLLLRVVAKRSRMRGRQRTTRTIGAS